MAVPPGAVVTKAGEFVVHGLPYAVSKGGEFVVAGSPYALRKAGEFVMVGQPYSIAKAGEFVIVAVASPPPVAPSNRMLVTICCM